MIKLQSVFFFSRSLTPTGKWKLSGIYNRRNLMQENYNTGSEGAESQMRDGGRSNLEIDNRKSPPPPPFQMKKHKEVLYFCVESTNIVTGEGKRERKK